MNTICRNIITDVMKLDNATLERRLGFAERKMLETEDSAAFEAAQQLLNELKTEKKRRDMN